MNCIQRNINSLYRNPTLHKSIKVVMARQTLLQVTTPELTFSFSWVSAVQTILTVFGHSIWLCNGSIKSIVFRSAIENTTRNNKYGSNSRKWHLVVVIPLRWLLEYIYLYIYILFHTDEFVEIFFSRWQGGVYLTKLIPRLLLTWRHKNPVAGQMRGWRG